MQLGDYVTSRIFAKAARSSLGRQKKKVFTTCLTATVHRHEIYSAVVVQVMVHTRASELNMALF